MLSSSHLTPPLSAEHRLLPLSASTVSPQSAQLRQRQIDAVLRRQAGRSNSQSSDGQLTGIEISRRIAG
jgi:hypothetical protein